MTTPADIVRLPDVHVYQGFTRTVHAVVTGRDGYVDVERDEFDYDLHGEEGRALSDRIAVHVKEEEIVDMGDGRTAIDVIVLDGKPIAVVVEDGYDAFDHEIVVLDMAAVDGLLEAVLSLRKAKVDLTEEVGMDEDISQKLGLKPRSTPAP